MFEEILGIFRDPDCICACEICQRNSKETFLRRIEPFWPLRDLSDKLQRVMFEQSFEEEKVNWGILRDKEYFVLT
jgi:hypothetical protein